MRLFYPATEEATPRELPLILSKGRQYIEGNKKDGTISKNL